MTLFVSGCTTQNDIAYQNLLVGTWVSNGTVTLSEAEKKGTTLPDWVRESFGESAYIVTPKKLTFTKLSNPANERSWFKWSVSEETETHLILETGSAVMFQKQIKRYNKKIGCFENGWTFNVTDSPNDSFRYNHYYCKTESVNG